MNNEKRYSTVKLILSALCTAIIAVLAQISIPMPFGVPISLQTFAVALCGYFLGWKYGLISIACYLLLGVIGLPVFTGLKGGIGILMGVTGGFLVGFVIMVTCCGLGLKRKAVVSILFGVIGLLLCHALGVIWFAYVSSNALWTSLMAVSVPYLPKDILSVIGAYYLSGIIKKALQARNTGLA